MRWNLGQAARLANKGAARAVPLLLTPTRYPWPNSPETFKEHLAGILGSGVPDALVHAACLVAYLLGPARTPAWGVQWMRDTFSPEDLGLPFSWEDASAWRWAAVPFATGREGERCGKIHYALTARRAAGESRLLTPRWLADKLDESASSAIAQAAMHARKDFPGADFLYWPLVDHTTPGIAIGGASLGLAACLGFSSRSDDAICRIVATGELAPGSDDLIGVKHLPAKYLAASRARQLAFVYCRDEEAPPPARREDAFTELVEIDKLSEARWLWQFFTRDKDEHFGENILNFSRHYNNPAALLRYVCKVPVPLLKMAERDGVLARAGQALLKAEADIRVSFVKSLEPLMQQRGRNGERIMLILKPITPEILRGMARRRESAAADIADFKANWYGRMGRLEKVREWRAILDELTQAIGYGELWQKAFGYKVANVSNFDHSAFLFSPTAPEHIAADFQRIKTIFGNNADDEKLYCLGCFHGVMVQQYAYCGPKYLHQAEEQAALAKRNFDEPDDILRQDNHMVFAYLDAGQQDKALGSLLAYLRTDTLEAFAAQGDKEPWTHFALARFLAETGRELPGYGEPPMPLCEMRAHPWNLWLCNMARVFHATDSKRARSYLDQALAISLDYPDTVRVMGLLPLSYVHEFGWDDGDTRQHAAELTDYIRTNKFLNHEHFKDLLAQPRGKILDFVTARRAALFPFTYR